MGGGAFSPQSISPCSREFAPRTCRHHLQVMSRNVAAEADLKEALAHCRKLQREHDGIGAELATAKTVQEYFSQHVRIMMWATVFNERIPVLFYVAAGKAREVWRYRKTGG